MARQKNGREWARIIAAFLDWTFLWVLFFGVMPKNSTTCSKQSTIVCTF